MKGFLLGFGGTTAIAQLAIYLCLPHGHESWRLLLAAAGALMFTLGCSIRSAR